MERHSKCKQLTKEFLQLKNTFSNVAVYIRLTQKNQCHFYTQMTDWGRNQGNITFHNRHKQCKTTWGNVNHTSEGFVWLNTWGIWKKNKILEDQNISHSHESVRLTQ